MADKYIDFDNECWICGKPERFNVCVNCGVDIFMADLGGTGTEQILQYLKEKNPDRFNQMVKQAKEKSNG